MLHLIQMWLKAPIVEMDKDGTKRNIGGGKGNRKGTPQGGVISPLLSNLYLHLLDRIWERRNLPQQIGARIVRYADDIVVLCRRSTDPAMDVLRHVLERMGLQLNESKTRVVDAYQEMFTFLGFEFRMGKSRRTGKYFACVQPSKKSLKKIKDRITELTDRTRTIIPLGMLINEVNIMTCGWVGYFHKRNCSKALCGVRWHLEERVRTHLRKRHKVRDRETGYVRFTNRSLYETYGLYKVPTTAGWTIAHAVR
jgi:hypothetical protein